MGESQLCSFRIYYADCRDQRSVYLSSGMAVSCVKQHSGGDVRRSKKGFDNIMRKHLEAVSSDLASQLLVTQAGL